MKRERSPSVISLPRLSGRSVDVCRPHQNDAMMHKRLRGRHPPSFRKSGPAKNSTGAMTINSNSLLYQPETPITPTSTCASPPATFIQFADFFVDSASVSPSEAASLAEEMAADFYSEVSIMHSMLSDVKTPSAEGRAVDELMRRMHILLSAGNSGGNLPSQIANVYNGLIRVFIFLYQRYYRAFVVLEVDELLAASWQRLLAFVMEYRILDEVFVRKVYDHVVQVVASS